MDSDLAGPQKEVRTAQCNGKPTPKGKKNYCNAL